MLGLRIRISDHKTKLTGYGYYASHWTNYFIEDQRSVHSLRSYLFQCTLCELVTDAQY